MENDDTHIPATWIELRDHLASLPGGSANTFLYYFAQFSGSPKNSILLGPNFFSAADALIRCALMERVNVVEALMPQVSDRARAIAESEAEDYGQLDAANLAALAILTLQDAAGWQRADGLIDIPLRRLLQNDRQDDDSQRQTIWSLLAYGRTDSLARLLRADLNAGSPDLSEQFDANEYHVQLHFARCMSQGLDTGMAMSAWEVYLSYFPVNLATSTATWPELLWAARAIHVVIGGAAPDTLLEWLRDQVS